MAGSKEELNILFIYKNIKIKMVTAVEARNKELGLRLHAGGKQFVLL